MNEIPLSCKCMCLAGTLDMHLPRGTQTNPGESEHPPPPPHTHTHTPTPFVWQGSSRPRVPQPVRPRPTCFVLTPRANGRRGAVYSLVCVQRSTRDLISYSKRRCTPIHCLCNAYLGCTYPG